MNVIVDYRVGNLESVRNAFARLGVTLELASDPETVENADFAILPGVGAFKDAMDALNETGLADAIKKRYAAGRPTLGICLGMQLLYESSSEDGFCQGLGLLKGRFEKLKPTEANLKIPHMGWNALTATQSHPLIPTEFELPHVYFVHSYALVDWAQEEVLMTTEYGITIPAIVAKGPFVGMQFHPEKSAYVGKKILKRLIAYFKLEEEDA